MIAHIPLICPYCKKTFNLSELTIGELLRDMKMNKASRVAVELHEKRGPFYDRWLAAMEARGEQKRCKDCVYYEGTGRPRMMPNTGCKNIGYTGGMFACKFFKSREEDR